MMRFEGCEDVCGGGGGGGGDGFEVGGGGGSGWWYTLPYGISRLGRKAKCLVAPRA